MKQLPRKDRFLSVVYKISLEIHKYKRQGQIMHQIALLTATYNHPNELMRLFHSLKEQTEKGFTWVIVNDGSAEETSQVLKLIEGDNAIDVEVINKNNGGKSSSINVGFDNIDKNVEFVLIVDDDEKLKPDAINVVKEYVNKYRSSGCGVIHFNRINENGEIIAKPPINEDFFMTFQQFKSEGRYADGYLGYFFKALGKNRFSIFPGEKYVAPSTLIMKVNRTRKLLWASAVLGETEYLAGGITKQGRKLRIKNPRGMVEYCQLMQTNGANLKTKLLYSAQGYAYKSFCNCNDKNIDNSFLAITKPAGLAIALLWKTKYL